MHSVIETTPNLSSSEITVELSNHAQFDSGLVIIFGSTATGKTSTLLALLDDLDRQDLARHHDVIAIDEIKDSSTLTQALSLINLGHLVIATLHCNSAEVVISRLMSLASEFQDLNEIQDSLYDSIKAVIHCSRSRPDLNGVSQFGVDIVSAENILHNPF